MTVETALAAGFGALVLVALLLDLGVLGNSGSKPMTIRKAAAWSAVWIILALLFGASLHVVRGPEAALQFFAGWLMEKALSVDNLFVFISIFAAFGIAPRHQHRVLMYGIAGALAMRAIFILAGVALLERFHALTYVFGVLLVGCAWKMLSSQASTADPLRHPLVRWLRRHVPVERHSDAGEFIRRSSGRWAATPLLLALVAVEAADLVFAIDSIPAILAITVDPFIVCASNVFAILGLRSLYFVLAGALERLHRLHYGLAAALFFVGVKMLIAPLLPISTATSLMVLAVCLAGGVAASLWRSR